MVSEGRKYKSWKNDGQLYMQRWKAKKTCLFGKVLQ